MSVTGTWIMWEFHMTNITPAHNTMQNINQFLPHEVVMIMMRQQPGQQNRNTRSHDLIIMTV